MVDLMGKSIKEVGVGFVVVGLSMLGVFLEGRTLLDSDSNLQLRHALIHPNIFCRMVAGTSSLLTWLSLLGQSLKQYFWRNQQWQHLHLSLHWGRLSTCLPAKFKVHNFFVSMQILLWGKLFFTSKWALSFPFSFFFPLHFPSFGSRHFPPPPGPATVVSFGDFIEKVRGRSMWKEPKLTSLTSGRKSMIESLTLLQFAADLHSFNQIWNLELTAKRNLAGIFLSRRSFALKIDLCWFIMFIRTLGH